MGRKFRLFTRVALVFLVLCLIACTTNSLTGALFVVTSNNVVTPFTVTLNNGALTAINSSAPTGSSPVAALLSADGNHMFVLNQGDNTISAYNVGSNGGVSTVGSPTHTNSAFPTGSPCASVGNGATSTPVAMTIDNAGHLFVANLGAVGSPGDPSSQQAGAISVFTISNGTSLSEVAGSPFCTLLQSEINAGQVTNSPAAVAVTPNGKFLYVASQIDKTVISYSVASSGVISEILQRENVGTNPSGLIVVEAPNSSNPQGEFLDVANAGSSNVSAFAICDAVVVSCPNPNQPDGSLTEVNGSPFSAGLGPLAMAASPDGQFLFVVNSQSNQISQFKVTIGTGVLVPNTQATIGTGGNPVSIAIRVGTTKISSTNGTEDFVFVTNRGGATMFSYSFDSTLGNLTEITPTATQGQPAAVVAK